MSIVGIGLTLVAQSAMGASWRGDVDPTVRTRLVTDGPFRWVRNPILAATELTSIGVVLLVPNVVTVAGLGLVVASHQVLVRLVEEPYLIRVHGDAYLDYASRTGRFIPGIGRLRRGVGRPPGTALRAGALGPSMGNRRSRSIVGASGRRFATSEGASREADMDEREQAIRATADDLIADADELKAIERQKASMRPDDPRLDGLAEDAQDLVKDMATKTAAQREVIADSDDSAEPGPAARPG